MGTAACTCSNFAYIVRVSANELLEQVKSLPLRERRKFFHGIHELEEGLGVQETLIRKRPVRWPDAAARRRRICGDRVLPNLVLLAREEEHIERPA